MAGDSNQAQPVLAANQTPVVPGFQVQATIAPLNVSGLVVTRADLVAALRIYVPQLVDIALLDGERFLLSLVAGTEQEGGVRHG